MATSAQIATIATALGNRYSSQILIEITNPQDSTQTAINTTRRDNAIDDADAYFRMNGITLDAGDNMHTAVMIEGAFIRLQVVAGNFPIGAWNEWKNTVRDLASVTSRNRVTPFTNSVMTPTAEQLGSKPFSDLSRQKRYKGRGPSTGDNTFE